MLESVYARLDSPSRDPAAPPRWNFPPSRPQWLLRCDAATRVTTLYSKDGPVSEWTDPLEALAWMEHVLTRAEDLDARWIGFLSYDLGRLFEVIPDRTADDLALPLFAFTLQYRTLETLKEGAADPAHAALVGANFTRPQYEAAVARAVDYISAGDVFQVNLSQRFSVRWPGTAAGLYARLRLESPACYGACLDYGDFALLSNSPELFLKVTPHPDGTRTVTTRPIKGTRPRLPGMDAELLHSEKDQAELNMIVDLERNDLGRVCEIGTVKVTQPRAIEEHPTVYHGAATVEGKLRPGVSFVDLLRATFPGGSITGAPKIRAMEIIEELEPTRRGPYCGAIGYLSTDGHVEFNVAIRTMIVKDGLVHVPVGGGVVADSTPQAEYEETLVKARAMFRALGVSPDDLRTD